MIPMQQIQDLAKSGADSVFGHIEHTAEKVPDGFRWQTAVCQAVGWKEERVKTRGTTR